MGRAAGNDPNYVFVLWDKSRNRYDKTVTLEFPSTSTIVKRTLAAPQLVPWAHKATKDIIYGLAQILDPMTFTAIFADVDGMDEFFKDNRLRPDDVRDDRAEEGTREHKTLERLATTALTDPEAAHERALQLQQSSNGYERGIADFWIDHTPLVVSTEEKLPCPVHGFMGTTDLVWYDGDMAKHVTDLKTRAAGRGVYISDQFQVEGYQTAYDILHPDEPSEYGSVLVAREDGTYTHEYVQLPRGAFLQLKSVHDLMRGVK